MTPYHILKVVLRVHAQAPYLYSGNELFSIIFKSQETMFLSCSMHETPHNLTITNRSEQLYLMYKIKTKMDFVLDWIDKTESNVLGLSLCMLRPIVKTGNHGLVWMHCPEYDTL